MSHSDMRFTTEQRLAALERENVVLHDTTELLHKMLKEQRQLINDYIIQTIAATDAGNAQTGGARAEEALYTFICRQRFDRLDKTIEDLRKQMAESASALSTV